MAKVIDGKVIAAIIQKEVQESAVELQREKGIRPGLAVLLVGERKDSQTYVRTKKKVAEEVGWVVYIYRKNQKQMTNHIRQILLDWRDITGIRHGGRSAGSGTAA